MKKFALIALGLVFLAACKETPKSGNFGETITADGAVAITEMVAKMEGQDEMTGKVIGKVEEVCQVVWELFCFAP